GGSVLRSVPPRVIETIARGVGEVAPDARVLVATGEPIVGAALLGLDALAADASSKARARAELDAAVAEVHTEDVANRPPPSPPPPAGLSSSTRPPAARGAPRVLRRAPRRSRPCAREARAAGRNWSRTSAPPLRSGSQGSEPRSAPRPPSSACSPRS